MTSHPLLSPFYHKLHCMVIYSSRRSSVQIMRPMMDMCNIQSEASHPCQARHLTTFLPVNFPCLSFQSRLRPRSLPWLTIQYAALNSSVALVAWYALIGNSFSRSHCMVPLALRSQYCKDPRYCY